MALNKEDKADVSRSMGKALANKVSKVTKDASNDKRFNAKKYTTGSKPTRDSEYFGKSYAQLQRESRSFSKMNAERKKQGYKPKTDRATKGLYDFLDKY